MSTVDLSSVIQGIQIKLGKEREQIAMLLANQHTLRKFDVLTEAVKSLQASVRALDVLTGQTDLAGNPFRPNACVITEGNGGQGGTDIPDHGKNNGWKTVPVTRTERPAPPEADDGVRYGDET